MIEVVRVEELFALIRRECPADKDINLEQRCGYGKDNGVFRNMERTRKWITLRVADKILTALELNHFLSTGELTIHSGSHFGEGGELVQGGNTRQKPRTNEELRQELSVVKEERRTYRKRMVYFEEQVALLRERLKKSEEQMEWHR